MVFSFFLRFFVWVWSRDEIRFWEAVMLGHATHVMCCVVDVLLEVRVLSLLEK